MANLPDSFWKLIWENMDELYKKLGELGVDYNEPYDRQINKSSTSALSAYVMISTWV